MRTSITAVALFLGVSLVGCGGSGPLPTPTAPAMLQSVSVGALRAGLAGQLQLFATGHFSDGGRDVTSLATWSSSDPTVATLAPPATPVGVLLTMLKPGATTITATYQDKTAVLSFQLGYCPGGTQLIDLIDC
jgi:hypothetical protein